MSHRKNKQPSVLVLGAGLAGLSAGYYLKKRHYNVTVLEARNRVGGRVDTRTIEGQPALTVEMGGEWIGAHHHHIRGLCRELHLKLVNHRLKMSLLYDGKYFKPREWKFGERWQKKLKQFAKLASRLTPTETQQLEATDWWHYLVTNHVSKRYLEIIDIFKRWL